MPNYVPVKNTKVSVPGWAFGAFRYFPYPLTMTCAEGEAEYRKLKTLALQLAYTSDVIPSAGPSAHWVPRGCSGEDVITDVEILDPDDQSSGASSVGGKVVASGTALYLGQPVSFIQIDTDS